MYKDKRILTVITARGGSKRLPGKNIKSFLGKPLIAYAIEAANGSQYVDRVVVTTDDEAIATVAKAYGAEVPFMRPLELASDTATSLDTLIHAVKESEKDGHVYDYIVLIQPTVPGVIASDVDAAIQKLVDSDVNCCITMCEITDRPEFMYRVSDNGTAAKYVDVPAMRMQDMEPLYRINGAVYITRRDILIEQGMIIDNQSCAAVLMPRERSVDIDTETDFIMAETLMSANSTNSRYLARNF